MVSRLFGPAIFEVSKLKFNCYPLVSLKFQNLNDHHRFLHSMQGVQAAPIVASSLEIIVGFSGLWAIVARFLSPLYVVPLITLVGLGLYELGFPGVSKCIEIGLPQLIALVFFSQGDTHQSWKETYF
ncbi:hypothetical protein SUGI_0994380 [Cryptomeria japonica]|nr:hypothetical protein SUGI_0994380 [Cryptomeria japonica]